MAVFRLVPSPVNLRHPAKPPRQSGLALGSIGAGRPLPGSVSSIAAMTLCSRTSAMSCSTTIQRLASAEPRESGRSLQQIIALYRGYGVEHLQPCWHRRLELGKSDLARLHGCDRLHWAHLRLAYILVETV